jgi:hypothetical protein
MELLVAMAISTIVAMAIGALLVGGQRSWQMTYDQTNRKIKQDAQAIMITFGSIGRKSNRLNYTLYNEAVGSYIPSNPQDGSSQVVYGDAVEFRYWSESGPTSAILDVTNTGTNYAFFYIDGDKKLKVDYGPVPPGAVPGGSGTKNATDITTTILADSVVPDPNGAFNHTTISEFGQGCVRINVTLQDEDDPDETVRVMTATLMRNIWPR